MNHFKSRNRCPPLTAVHFVMGSVQVLAAPKEQYLTRSKGIKPHLARQTKPHLARQRRKIDIQRVCKGGYYCFRRGFATVSPVDDSTNRTSTGPINAFDFRCP